jgi:hypothetical protein
LHAVKYLETAGLLKNKGLNRTQKIVPSVISKIAMECNKFRNEKLSHFVTRQSDLDTLFQGQQTLTKDKNTYFHFLLDNYAFSLI